MSSHHTRSTDAGTSRATNEAGEARPAEALSDQARDALRRMARALGAHAARQADVQAAAKIFSGAQQDELTSPPPKQSGGQ
jgi:hypothetical protein